MLAGLQKHMGKLTALGTSLQENVNSNVNQATWRLQVNNRDQGWDVKRVGTVLGETRLDNQS